MKCLKEKAAEWESLEVSVALGAPLENFEQAFQQYFISTAHIVSWSTVIPRFGKEVGLDVYLDGDCIRTRAQPEKDRDQLQSLLEKTVVR